jgi:excisionase family DNA binding protein
MSHIIETQIAEIKQFITQQTLANKDHLNLGEAAIYLTVSKSYIYKLTCKREIPFYRPGTKLIYFKRTELDEWLLQNRQSTHSEIEAQVLNKKKS